MKYEYFSGCKKELDKEYLANITDEQLKQWKIEILEINTRNDVVWAENANKLAGIVEGIKELFGVNSAEYKYMSKKHPLSKPSIYIEAFWDQSVLIGLKAKLMLINRFLNKLIYSSIMLKIHYKFPAPNVYN